MLCSLSLYMEIRLFNCASGGRKQNSFTLPKFAWSAIFAHVITHMICFPRLYCITNDDVDMGTGSCQGVVDLSKTAMQWATAADSHLSCQETLGSFVCRDHHLSVCMLVNRDIWFCHTQHFYNMINVWLDAYQMLLYAYMCTHTGTLFSPCLPCQIVMPQFSQHWSNGNKWYSQPFYSEPGGYKLCLNVVAKGDGCGAGTHVSVYVYLMKGKYDDWLKWPFECNVEYGILNWKRNANHIIRTVHFSAATAQCNSRVTSSERAVTGWGYSQFLSHSSLFDNSAETIQYLQQDCLCLQVLKVEPPEETDVD